jgi:hypothetical protein
MNEHAPGESGSVDSPGSAPGVQASSSPDINRAPSSAPADPSVTRSRRFAVRLIALGVVWAILTFLIGFDALPSAVAVLAGYTMMRVGIAMVRPLASPVPEPPEAGELRKVKLHYRCSVCGTEVKMMVATTEDPEPPRHCLEDMDLLTPIE